MIYLDNAATTAVSAEVLDAMLPYLQTHYGNPNAIHAAGRQARAAIEAARRTVAGHLNCSIGEIFFTSCGTESNNTAIQGAVRDLAAERVISSPTEHHCVLNTLIDIEKRGLAEVCWLPLNADGSPSLEALEQILGNSSKRTLVSVMHANNELGVMTDLERLSAICRAHGAILHTDTVQTMGHFEIDLAKTKIGFLSGSAHKFHGPKGVGFLYMSGENIVKPLIHGGAQERNMRAGTENVAGIVGLAKALDMAYKELESRRTHITGLKNAMKTALKSALPDVIFNDEGSPQSLYHVLSVSLPESLRTQLLLFNLDIAGICASGAAACSSGVEQASHVLVATGHPENRRVVRFSFSHYNTLDEIEKTVQVLKGLV